MPKKFKQNQYSKPASSVHPSLSSANHGSSSAPKPPSPSVNDLIRQSRRAQSSSATGQDIQALINAPTVHPSLQSLLRLPHHPVPRARHRETRRPSTQQTTAGPAPPKSWQTTTTRTAEFATHTLIADDIGLGDVLPDLSRPSDHSLTHLVLERMAHNWQWHVEVDGVFLGHLAAHTKQMLLSYIARYSAQGVTKAGLKAICRADDNADEISSCESITHLDLGRALDGEPFARSIFALLIPTGKSVVPEAWDAPPLRPELSIPFPALTHLSLASPTPHPTLWSGLLRLLPRLIGLTHLSLAHWPAPIEPRVTRILSGSVFNAPSVDWTESMPFFRRLSGATLYLRWFCVTGCVWTLGLSEPGAADWRGCWRGVRTLRAEINPLVSPRWQEEETNVIELAERVNLKRKRTGLSLLQLELAPEIVRRIRPDYRSLE